MNVVRAYSAKNLEVIVFRILIALVIPFAVSLAGCAGEQRAWEDAVSLDLREAYESYLENFADGEFSQTALEKIAFFEEVEWEQARSARTLEAFTTFQSSFPNSKYRTEVEFWLPWLEQYPSGEFPIDALKAIEDEIIAVIEGEPMGNRFVIEGIDINSDTRGGRFQVVPVTTSGRGPVLLTTTYPDDSFPIQSPFGVAFGTGSEIVNGLTPLHFAHGTVWRIAGRVERLLSGPQEYVIDGDEDDPLSFYLFQGRGAVYLHGRGTVETADGEVIFARD